MKKYSYRQQIESLSWVLAFDTRYTEEDKKAYNKLYDELKQLQSKACKEIQKVSKLNKKAAFKLLSDNNWEVEQVKQSLLK